MKRNLLLFIIALQIISVTSCSVNNASGSVTVINYSDKDALNFQIGNLYIGFIGKGQTVTTYFFQKQSLAKISDPGFQKPDTVIDNSTTPVGTKKAEATIDLELNYIYTFSLIKTGGKYNFNGQGMPFGKDITSMSDYILMK